MFHLLVNYKGWHPAQDMLSADRLFEYTDPTLVALFRPNNSLDEAGLLQHPALMMTETGGSGLQTARVCTLRNVSLDGSLVRIGYSAIEGMPTITNARLTRLASELRIELFEFSRTHWAVKDVDLFRALLQDQASSPLSPKLFRFSDPVDAQADLVSVMMPFDTMFDDVFQIIRSAAEAERMRCLRADNFWRDDAIVQNVVTLLDTSRVVVCDCTGKNPNVFYELGIAHALGRNTILLTQSIDDIPFDLRHVRHIEYRNSVEGRQALSVQLRERIRTLRNLAL